MADKVALVKLVSGEEIFCSVRLSTEEEINNICVNFPVQAVADEDGRIKFYPWLNAEENMTPDIYMQLSPMAIMTVCTPTSSIVDAYTKFKNAFFSKIIQPTPEEQNIVLNKSVKQ